MNLFINRVAFYIYIPSGAPVLWCLMSSVNACWAKGPQPYVQHFARPCHHKLNNIYVRRYAELHLRPVSRLILAFVWRIERRLNSPVMFSPKMNRNTTLYHFTLFIVEKSTSRFISPRASLSPFLSYACVIVTIKSAWGDIWILATVSFSLVEFSAYVCWFAARRLPCFGFFNIKILQYRLECKVVSLCTHCHTAYDKIRIECNRLLPIDLEHLNRILIWHEV